MESESIVKIKSDNMSVIDRVYALPELKSCPIETTFKIISILKKLVFGIGVYILVSFLTISFANNDL